MTKIQTQYESEYKLMTGYIKTNKSLYIGREYQSSEYQYGSIEFDDNERNYKLTNKDKTIELKIYDGTGEYDIVEVDSNKLIEVLNGK